MTDNAIQQWLASRFPPHVAAVLWQQYLAAKDSIGRIGTAALDFPAQKDIFTHSMAQGPNGELPWEYDRKTVCSRLGSRTLIWPLQDVHLFPNGDYTKPDLDTTAAFVRQALDSFPADQQAPIVFLDIEQESWDFVDYVHPSTGIHREVIPRLVKLIQDLRAKLPPHVKIGMWGPFPPSNIRYWACMPSMFQWIVDATEVCGPVLQALDYAFTDWYFEPKPTTVPNFDFCFTAEEVSQAIQQATLLAKSIAPQLRVCPSLMLDQYKLWQEQQQPDSPEKTRERSLPADVFRKVAGAALRYGDGLHLWILQPLDYDDNHPPVFDWTLPWIPVLEDYLVRYGVMPWSVTKNLVNLEGISQ